ncbi:MAG TPA: hypothetical protein VJ044_07960 [Candidatus Hodarchaeales archaeon]|nr:hypothetical protein [Candidatus Hodarchaeales archaeon]
MDIEEAVSRKRQLEKDILGLLVDFENATGTKITAVDCERSGIVKMYSTPEISEVKVTVSLPDRY